MLYFGGKEKIASDIAMIINENLSDCEGYMEPFVGGGSLFKEIYIDYGIPYIINDLHGNLIAMYKGLDSGWFPTDELVISNHKEYKDFKPTYLELKECAKKGISHHKYSNAFMGYVGFACSFLGNYYSTYAIGKTTDQQRIFYNSGLESLRQLKYNVQRATIENLDWIELLDKYKPVNYMIYLDPPYANTPGYKVKFDYKGFWDKVRSLSKENIVLISEYKAPEDFVPIWTKSYIMNSSNKGTIATDKLFVHKDSLSKVRYSVQLNMFEV